ncbi:DUF2786 domain-containing protein [Streptomyces fragilis]|uniref:DUF2786 domain-containing protein n=1 Tax=Streptomyces fragilis TaxID=67301 RepID=A0ABV2YHR0_9ACTN|nr:DUF2786 domain-containing protein [Streptomyces fragilis]
MSTTEPGTVERAFAAALYADTDTALDAGASLLAADPGADAELSRRGRELTAALWRRGWQPADVVRMVRRELEEAHVHVVSDLILAEAGAPEDSRPDPRQGSRNGVCGGSRPGAPARGRRWAAQLAELTPAPPRHEDRFTRATVVLELYRLLLRLPALEPVVEPRPRPAAGEAERAEPASRMLGRIRALLAKAEATGYPEEAEALTAKAQELMARHSIDEALLAPDGSAGGEGPAAGGPGACRIGVEPPYEQAKAVLLDAVARANNCQAVWNEAFCFSTVVGHEADLEVVELLYTSLLVQATGAMTKAEAALRKGGGKGGGRRRTKTFRQSFLAAYAHRMGARLAEAAEHEITEAKAEAGQALMPVLASREAAVRAETDRLFPHTRTTRLRGVSDEEGWIQGRDAADRARMGRRPGIPGRGGRGDRG